MLLADGHVPQDLDSKPCALELRCTLQVAVLRSERLLWASLTAERDGAQSKVGQLEAEVARLKVPNPKPAAP